MTIKAKMAVKAAKNAKNWGLDASRRFATKNGVSARLYRIARQCEASTSETFERREHG